MFIVDGIKTFGRRSWKTFTSLFGLVLTGFLLITVGILLHGSQNHLLEQLALFLTELGFAFLIAVILFGAFEEWAAREHKKSAIAHIYGMKPDGEVFDLIEDHVLKQRFYRSRLVVTYAFRRQVGENILVEQSTKYLVTNVCSRYDSSKLEIKGHADLKPLHAGDTDWDAELGLKTLTLIRKDNQGLSREVIPNDQIERTADAVAHTESFEVKQEIPLAFEDSIGVEVVHHLVVRDHDSAVWTAAFPSTELEFHVTWEESIRLKFAFSATHPMLGNLEPEKGPRSRVLKLNTPFLKAHGIHVRWSPDESEPAPSPAAGVAGGGEG